VHRDAGEHRSRINAVTKDRLSEAIGIVELGRNDNRLAGRRNCGIMPNVKNRWPRVGDGGAVWLAGCSWIIRDGKCPRRFEVISRKPQDDVWVTAEPSGFCA